MAMRKEKPKSAVFIKKKNKKLTAIYNAMIEEFGVEKIKEVANDVNFDISVLDREVNSSEMDKVFPAIVSFVAISLAEIDQYKAKRVLMSSGIPEADINIFMGI